MTSADRLGTTAQFDAVLHSFLIGAPPPVATSDVTDRAAEVALLNLQAQPLRQAVSTSNPDPDVAADLVAVRERQAALIPEDSQFAAGSLHDVVFAAYQLHVATGSREALDSAVAAGRRGVQLLDTGLPASRAVVFGLRTYLALALGQLGELTDDAALGDEALAVSADAVSLVADRNDAALVALSRATAYLIRASAGSGQDALDALGQAAEAADAGVPEYHVMALGALGYALLYLAPHLLPPPEPGHGLGGLLHSAAGDSSDAGAHVEQAHGDADQAVTQLDAYRDAVRAFTEAAGLAPGGTDTARRINAGLATAQARLASVTYQLDSPSTSSIRAVSTNDLILLNAAIDALSNAVEVSKAEGRSAAAEFNALAGALRDRAMLFSDPAGMREALSAQRSAVAEAEPDGLDAVNRPGSNGD
ncbi:hypothetical protein StrepF001_42460, partial [Streptomyces sp. F001]|uniref:hypothetical protein n=1 Tax=Streptomyces sp. F001 TaxID=1510026 RepID=UPI0010D39419